MTLRSLLVFCLLSAPALADWSLDKNTSQLFFVSTKNAQISEVHHFDTLSGKIDGQGDVRVTIDLSSVKTGIDIRDSRMREKLFHVDVTPDAVITAKLPATVMEMPAGEATHIDIDATLSIGGISTKVALPLFVTKTRGGDLTATNARPIILQASQLGLSEGLDVLQKLAGLNSISQTVPVTLHARFTPAQ